MKMSNEKKLVHHEEPPAYNEVTGYPGHVPTQGEGNAPVGQPYAPAGLPYAPAGQPYAPAGQPYAPAGQPYGQPYAPAGQPYAAAASGQPYAPTGQPYGVPITTQPGAQIMVVPAGLVDPPPDHMMFNVFMTLCCCLLIGIFGILKSNECRRAANRGDRERAIALSGEAKRLGYWALGVGSFFTIGYVVLIILVNTGALIGRSYGY